MVTIFGRNIPSQVTNCGKSIIFQICQRTFKNDSSSEIVISCLGWMPPRPNFFQTYLIRALFWSQIFGWRSGSQSYALFREIIKSTFLWRKWLCSGIEVSRIFLFLYKVFRPTPTEEEILSHSGHITPWLAPIWGGYKKPVTGSHNIRWNLLGIYIECGKNAIQHKSSTVMVQKYSLYFFMSFVYIVYILCMLYIAKFVNSNVINT